MPAPDRDPRVENPRLHSADHDDALVLRTMDTTTVVTYEYRHNASRS
jgi:hypothetical protein